MKRCASRLCGTNFPKASHVVSDVGRVGATLLQPGLNCPACLAKRPVRAIKPS